jgi:hypothetical protein
MSFFMRVSRQADYEAEGFSASAKQKQKLSR